MQVHQPVNLVVLVHHHTLARLVHIHVPILLRFLCVLLLHLVLDRPLIKDLPTQDHALIRVFLHIRRRALALWAFIFS